MNSAGLPTNQAPIWTMQASPAPPGVEARLSFNTHPQEAPAWTIPFGREFWRKRVPANNQSNPTGKALPLPPNLNLADVTERVSHAFSTNSRTDLPEVRSRTYSASFDQTGLRFSPFAPHSASALGMTSPRPYEAQGQPSTFSAEHPPAIEATDVSASLRTISVTRSAKSIYDSRSAEPKWSILGNTAQALLDASSGLVEHYEARRHGVELAWIFPTRPLGSGDVLIEAQLTGLRHVETTANGHHYADATGTARLRVGTMRAIDAAGRSWELDMKVREDRMLVDVPDFILRSATFPLAIDPLLSPEFQVDRLITYPPEGHQNLPSIASNGTDFFVAWQESNLEILGGIRGTRINADGSIPTPWGILIDPTRGERTPKVFSDGKDYFILWSFVDRIHLKKLRARESRPDQLVVIQTRNAVNLALAFDSTGGYLVWNGQYSVGYLPNAIRVDLAGVPVGPEFTLLPPQHLGPVRSVSSNGRDILATVAELVVGADGGGHYRLNGFILSGSKTPDTATAIPISTNHFGYIPSCASASMGKDILVSWAEDTSLFSSMLRSDRSLTPPVLIHTYPDTAPPGDLKALALTNKYLLCLLGRNLHQRLDLDPAGRALRPASLFGSFSRFFEGDFASDGSMVMVASTDKSWPTPNRGYDVVATRFSNEGDLLGENIHLGNETSFQEYPVVAFNGNLSLVVWSERRRNHYTEAQLVGSRVDFDGNVLDPAGIELSSSLENQLFPEVASAGGDFYVICWQQGLSGTLVRASGEVPNLPGTPLDPAGSTRGSQTRPSIASNGETYLATWSESSNALQVPAGRVLGTRISKTGQLLDPSPIVFSREPTPEASSAVASDGVNFLVAHTVSGDIVVTRVRADGTVVDPDGILVAHGPLFEDSPKLTFNGSNYFLAWSARSSQGVWWVFDINGAFITPQAEVGSSIALLTQTGYPFSLAAQGRDYGKGDVFMFLFGGADSAGEGLRLDSTGRIIEKFTVGRETGTVSMAATYTEAGRFVVVRQSNLNGAWRMVGSLFSTLQPLSLRDGKAVLAWEAKPGLSYHIESTDEIQPARWTSLGQVTATNRLGSFGETISMGLPRRFYRVSQAP